MTAENVWIVVVAFCTSVASVVGFLVQVWSARKTGLEIEKLKLEIETLRKSQRSAGSCIVLPTFDEVNAVVRAQQGYVGDQVPSWGQRSRHVDDYRPAGVLLGIAALAAYIIWKHITAGS